MSRERYVEVGIQTPKFFKRNIFIRPEKLKEFAEKFGDRYSVYHSAYGYYKGSKTLYGNFYLDFDIENLDGSTWNVLKEDVTRAVTILKAFYQIDPDTNVLFYFSGHKGIHVIVPTTVEHERLNKAFYEIAREIYEYLPHKLLDLKIYDNKRLFRIPNTINHKTGLYKIPLTYSELIMFSYEQLIELSRNTRIIEKIAENNPTFDRVILHYCNREDQKEKFVKAKKKIDFTPQCIKEIISSRVEKGKRNVTILILASHLFQRGFSIEKTLDLIIKWSNNHMDPPLTQREIVNTVRSVYKHGYTIGCNYIKFVLGDETEKVCKRCR